MNSTICCCYLIEMWLAAATRAYNPRAVPLHLWDTESSLDILLSLSAVSSSPSRYKHKAETTGARIMWEKRGSGNAFLFVFISISLIPFGKSLVSGGMKPTASLILLAVSILCPVWPLPSRLKRLTPWNIVAIEWIEEWNDEEKEQSHSRHPIPRVIERWPRSFFL